VFIDGIVLKRSWGGEVCNISVLVAIGASTDGYQEVIGVAEGAKEDIYPKTKVRVAEWLDGSIHILLKNRELNYEEINPQVLRQERTERRIAEAISTISYM
jgi:transposase-like protein